MDHCEIEEKNFQEKVNQQDNVPSRVTTEVDLEENHTKFRKFAEKLRAEYYEAYRQMTMELRPSHLDGFTEVLKERQNQVVQNQEELICEIREQLMHYLQISLDQFWDEFNIADRIAELEMLKEQYKLFEGRSWNVHHMIPLERTLPLRIYFKEAKLRCLEKQLNYQNEQLKSLMAVTCKERSRIRNLEEQRKSMLLTLVRYTKDIELIKPPAKQIIDDLILHIDNDLVLN